MGEFQGAVTTLATSYHAKCASDDSVHEAAVMSFNNNNAGRASMYRSLGTIACHINHMKAGQSFDVPTKLLKSGEAATSTDATNCQGKLKSADTIKTELFPAASSTEDSNKACPLLSKYEDDIRQYGNLGLDKDSSDWSPTQSKCDAVTNHVPTSTSDPSTGQYFRLTSLANTNGNYWCMGEIEFLDSQNNRADTTGATYDGSSTSGTPTGDTGYSPKRAFDGGSTGDDFCSEWTTNTGWIQIKFPSAITVANINMRPDVTNDCPTTFKWESSSIGVTWTQMGSTQGPGFTWTGPYLFPVPSSTSGSSSSTPGVDNSAASLQGHWDATDSASFITDADGNVEKWSDLSTGGFHLATTTDQTSYRPNLISNGINNHPAVDFSGTDYLASSIKHPTYYNEPFTWIAVVQSDDGSSYDNIFSTNDAPKVTSGSYPYLPVSMSTDREHGWSSTSDNSYKDGTVTQSNEMVILTYTYTGSSFNAYLDKVGYTTLGNKQIDNWNPSSNWGSHVKQGYVALGRGQQNGSHPFNGKIGELLAYKEVLSDSELTTIIDGLKSKWS